MRKKEIIFLLAGIALLIGLSDMPDYYYQLLKLFICGIGSYGAYYSYQNKQKKWMWLFGVIALIFNPFTKADLEEELWKIVSLVTGIVFISHIYSDELAQLARKIYKKSKILIKEVVINKWKNISRKWKICTGVVLSLTIVLLIGRGVILRNFPNLLSKGAPWQVAIAIKAGADVNNRIGGWYGGYYLTPLMWAVESNTNPEIVKTLINSGALVNDMLWTLIDSNTRNTSPLMVAAAYNKNPEVIKTLIKAGADLLNGIPVELAAAYNPNPEVIKTLVHAGMNVNRGNVGALTPLMLAAEKNPNPEVIKTLIQLGADVNAKDADGSTPLMLAAKRNPNPEVIKTLIQLGADANAKDADGSTPLMYASEQFKPNFEIIELLLQSKANINAKNNDNATALHWASFWSESDAEVIKRLIQAGADINARNTEGQTPLMYATESFTHFNHKAVEVLIQSGADKKLRDNKGMTAFDYLNKNEKAKTKPEYSQLERLLKS